MSFDETNYCLYMNMNMNVSINSCCWCLLFVVVLQVGKAGGSGGNRFFDLAVGNGITNANKHGCAPLKIVVLLIISIIVVW